MVVDTRPNTLKQILEDTKYRARNGQLRPLSNLPIYEYNLDDLFKDDPLLSSDTGVWTVTYGEKVWDSLNNQTKFFNLLRHVDWGPSSGWRIRNARQVSSAPVSEDGAIPDSDVQAYKTVYSPPKWVVSHGEVTMQAQFLAGVDDGLGNAMAKEQEFMALDHAKEINKELLRASAVECDTAVTGVTISLYTSGATQFRAGDGIAVVDDNSVNPATISSIAASTDTLTCDTTATGDQYSVVCAQSRAGPTSLDDLVNITLTATGTRDLSHAVGWPDVNVYNIDRSGATVGEYQDCAWYSAASGVPRELTLDLLDRAIMEIGDNGGEPDLILTGLDMVDKIGMLMQAQHRYLDVGTFQVKRAGEATLQGFQTGFQVATYRGIPIFADNDVYKLNIDGTNKGSVIYVLDTRFLELAIAKKTTYYESDNFIAAGKLNYDFIFYTGLELRCQDITKQAKIWDLAAVY